MNAVMRWPTDDWGTPRTKTVSWHDPATLGAAAAEQVAIGGVLPKGAVEINGRALDVGPQPVLQSRRRYVG